MKSDIFVSASQAATVLGYTHPTGVTKYLDRIGFPVEKTPGGWRRYSLAQLRELKERLDARGLLREETISEKTCPDV